MPEGNAYIIGDIVTLKSHPLLKSYTPKNSKKQFPPLLLIQEALFENKKKKVYSDEKIFSDEKVAKGEKVDEIKAAKIADNLKYICVYFNDKKSEFVEVPLYHAYLSSYKDLKFHREKDEEGNETKSEVNLIDEVKDYELKEVKEYEFGGIVQLKTSKLESRKKTGFAKKKGYSNMAFCSPNFVLTGIKREVSDGLFYHDGKPKRKVSEIFYKVMWFNHYQNKFSEKYLPKEFFIEPLDF